MLRSTPWISKTTFILQNIQCMVGESMAMVFTSVYNPIYQLMTVIPQETQVTRNWMSFSEAEEQLIPAFQQDRKNGGVSFPTAWYVRFPLFLVLWRKRASNTNNNVISMNSKQINKTCSHKSSNRLSGIIFMLSIDKIWRHHRTCHASTYCFVCIILKPV
jgi:hypothetical protein